MTSSRSRMWLIISSPGWTADGHEWVAYLHNPPCRGGIIPTQLPRAVVNRFANVTKSAARPLPIQIPNAAWFDHGAFGVYLWDDQSESRDDSARD